MTGLDTPGLGIDHLAYAAADLDAAVADVGRRFGVAPAAGGRHVGVGTRGSSILGACGLGASTFGASILGASIFGASAFLANSGAGALFGDGLRCTSGAVKRLYVMVASGGVVLAPQPGDPSITARSSALGDPIPLGATRVYQVYYRDPNLAFCPNPPGNSWNISNGVSIAW